MTLTVRRPSLPSSVLPKLPRSLTNSDLSSDKLLSLIEHLRLLYAPADDRAHPTEEEAHEAPFSHEVEEDDTVDPLWAQDAFERTWTVNWLNMVVRRGEDWIQEAQDEGNNAEKQLRVRIVDEAAGLVSLLTATSEGGAILRPLLLPTCPPDAETQTEPLLITLNDALPSSLDPTSVGLQSWGSSIILARMIALDPIGFGLGVPDHRALELGAGTGLLSLVWKGMSERLGAPCEVFATDYHDGVLENLRRNVEANSAAITPVQSPAASPPLKPSAYSSSSSLASSNSSLPVQAHKLDWSAVHSSRSFASANPGQPMEISMPPPFDKPFHTLLAADVVYGPTHASWLKSCVEQFLVKPDAIEQKEAVKKLPEQMANLSLGDAKMPLPERPALHSTESAAAVESAPTHVATTTTTSTEPTAVFRPAFHLIVPLRPTHAEAIASIKDVFPKKEDLPERQEGEPWRVAVETITEIERVQGVGRADEENYRLYRIGWC
ncbi:S-adenosylmethionine-dependent methyltransferase [Rhodotorula toruloides]|uniref:BY PROTMAP: gi/472583336/gb/EMS20979.1/ S-adenosylmethionine-dependent methyltransferase [Rhodosporidium toruloides NP11] gi/647401749/emb/CDR48104.1/ RHTO0S16e01332g1_1 [Rhodosporidium toruloides] n=1 Tax=Rhodotorula toruloides TaxID=5286 RepID=A0A0K3C9M9_RHOTO|nr:S-adenosylmethionine-dependent methyltransferase [Rhodotorula toruloides]PRQ76795.1 hypothetical protein AAT19DRAFT_12213 [Rhodotorula toruloides]